VEGTTSGPGDGEEVKTRGETGHGIYGEAFITEGCIE